MAAAETLALTENGLTCKAAAMNGHLHALQWLRSQDPPCPWRAYMYGCSRNSSPNRK
jgi:hypothetical protein